MYGSIRVAVRDCDSTPGSVMKVRCGALNERMAVGLTVRSKAFVDMTGGRPNWSKAK